MWNYNGQQRCALRSLATEVSVLSGNRLCVGGAGLCNKCIEKCIRIDDVIFAVNQCAEGCLLRLEFHIVNVSVMF